MLAHLQELTSEQKNELFQIILDEKEQISSYNSSELLMPILRTLKPNIAFENINETFPNFYSKWPNPEHLRQVFYDSKFDFNKNHRYSKREQILSTQIIVSKRLCFNILYG